MSDLGALAGKKNTCHLRPSTAFGSIHRIRYAIRRIRYAMLREGKTDGVVKTINFVD
jgi:hypothetical protein